MAGERHERSQTVQVYDSLLPPPFRPGCGLSGKRSSCAIIGPCSLDVTDSTFDTTNQREEAVGSVRGLIRKWAGHCVGSSQWAAGRPRERRRERLRVPPQALHPWSELPGRGEPSLQRSLAVALAKAHGVPGLWNGGENDRGADRAGKETPERAPQCAPHPPSCGFTLRSGSVGNSAPCPDAATHPRT